MLKASVKMGITTNVNYFRLIIAIVVVINAFTHVQPYRRYCLDDGRDFAWWDKQGPNSIGKKSSQKSS